MYFDVIQSMETRKTSREASQKALNIIPLAQSANQNVYKQRGDGLGTSNTNIQTEGAPPTKSHPHFPSSLYICNCPIASEL